MISCFSACVPSARWNADQIAEIRRRAAFDLSCPPEELEIVALARDDRGLVKKLRADGCGQRLTFVNAKSDAAAARWTLGTNQFQAANQPSRHAAK